MLVAKTFYCLVMDHCDNDKSHDINVVAYTDWSAAIKAAYQMWGRFYVYKFEQHPKTGKFYFFDEDNNLLGTVLPQSS